MKSPEKIALDSQLLGKIKQEALKFGGAVIAAAVIFQLVSYRESPLVVMRTVAAFFWTFVLPGFAIMLYWRERLDFLERLIIGTAVGLAAVATIGYNLGLVGLHLKYQWLVIPALVTAAGVAAALMKKKKKEEAAEKSG